MARRGGAGDLHNMHCKGAFRSYHCAYLITNDELGVLGMWKRALCIGALALAATGHAQTLQRDEPPVLRQSDFESCLAGLQKSAGFTGISASTWQRYVNGLQPDATVLPLLNRQPEFSMPVWDYMAVLVDHERVAAGRAAFQKWQPQLQRIAQQYGV